MYGCAQRFRVLGQFLVYELLCQDQSDAVHLCEALLQTMGVDPTAFFRFVLVQTETHRYIMGCEWDGGVGIVGLACP